MAVFERSPAFFALVDARTGFKGFSVADALSLAVFFFGLPAVFGCSNKAPIS
jgi:hypothetical protein